MRIAVFMKQVPGTGSVKMDMESGRLIRNSKDTITNPYDLSALEAALRIKEKMEAHITVFSMGPKSAERVLYEAYSLGAEEGVLITDKAFGGADVFATSNTIMHAVKKTGEFDLMIFGRQTTDGDTAQTGPAFAARMNLPFLGWVTDITCHKEYLIAEQNFEKQEYIVCVKYPVVMSVEREPFVVRIPNLAMKMAAKKKEINKITLEDLGEKTSADFGSKGSKTKVLRLFSPERKDISLVLDGQQNKTIEMLGNRILGIKDRS